MDPTSTQLEHAIRRNFGGLEKVKAYDIFRAKIPVLRAAHEPSMHIAKEVGKKKESFGLKVWFTLLYMQQQSILYPDCTPLGLIRTSLNTKETTWHGWVHYY